MLSSRLHAAEAAVAAAAAELKEVRDDLASTGEENQMLNAEMQELRHQVSLQKHASPVTRRPASHVTGLAAAALRCRKGSRRTGHDARSCCFFHTHPELQAAAAARAQAQQHAQVRYTHPELQIPRKSHVAQEAAAARDAAAAAQQQVALLLQAQGPAEDIDRDEVQQLQQQVFQLVMIHCESSICPKR
jgi:hypothetical protein